ncbi:MAG: potassium channel protein, partial [uncultured Solirubrobacteraceae bacterium]
AHLRTPRGAIHTGRPDRMAAADGHRRLRVRDQLGRHGPGRAARRRAGRAGELLVVLRRHGGDGRLRRPLPGDAGGSCRRRLRDRGRHRRAHGAVHQARRPHIVGQRAAQEGGGELGAREACGAAGLYARTDGAAGGRAHGRGTPRGRSVRLGRGGGEPDARPVVPALRARRPRQRRRDGARRCRARADGHHRRPRRQRDAGHRGGRRPCQPRHPHGRRVARPRPARAVRLRQPQRAVRAVAHAVPAHRGGRRPRHHAGLQRPDEQWRARQHLLPAGAPGLPPRHLRRLPDALRARPRRHSAGHPHCRRPRRRTGVGHARRGRDHAVLRRSAATHHGRLREL